MGGWCDLSPSVKPATAAANATATGPVCPPDVRTGTIRPPTFRPERLGEHSTGPAMKHIASVTASLGRCIAARCIAARPLDDSFVRRLRECIFLMY